MPILAFHRVVYYSPGDEAAMFGWLDRIRAVRRYWGVGETLFLSVTSRPSQLSLRELDAIYRRYGSGKEQQELLRVFPHAHDLYDL